MSGFDNKNTEENYYNFGIGVIRCVENKMNNFFQKEYCKDKETKKKISNMIFFYIKKICESINNDKNNILYVWINDMYVLDERFAKYIDNYAFENKTEYSDELVQLVKNNDYLEDIRDNEIVILLFEYSLIPKKIPICKYVMDKPK